MILSPPQVVNVRNSTHEIYIGLGSPWGNPYANTMARNAAIKAYEKRLRRFMEDAGWRVELKALAGKTIGCHCAPQPCHGDIIVKLFLELYGPQGTMVVDNHAMATTVRGMGPESQFHRPMHRAPVRGAGLPDESGKVDLGSVRAGSGRTGEQSGAGEEGSGERN